MTKKNSIFLSIFLFVSTFMLAVFTSGCSAEFNVSTARITEASVCRSVDPNTQKCIEKADVFAPDAAVIYCAGRVSNAPSGTKVQSHWFFGEQFITSAEVETSGSQYFSFSLGTPAAGWPAGNYSVKLLLNGEEKIVLPFSVQPD